MTVEQVNQGLVAVEACDREAAAAFLDWQRTEIEEWAGDADEFISPYLSEHIRAGRRDDHPVVQSHARHRLAEQERCAGIVIDRSCDVTAGIGGATPQEEREWRLIAIELASVAKAIRSSSEGPKG